TCSGVSRPLLSSNRSLRFSIFAVTSTLPIVSVSIVAPPVGASPGLYLIRGHRIQPAAEVDGLNIQMVCRDEAWEVRIDPAVGGGVGPRRSGRDVGGLEQDEPGRPVDDGGPGGDRIRGDGPR